MIDLYQFPPAFDTPNLSPFCMKLEAFLRIADIPFQIMPCKDPDMGPKGKLPFIRDNGVMLGDTELIMDYLESKLDFRVDGHLTSQQQAIQHACIRMLDEHLYWALIYSRWIDEVNWETLRQRLFGEIPPPLSSIAANKARKQMRRQLEAQGLGLHSREEIYSKAIKDLESLSALLGDKKWFGGDYVSKLDLTAVGYLSNIMIPQLPSPMAEAVKRLGNLETYAVRAQRSLFPEFTRAQQEKRAKQQARVNRLAQAQAAAQASQQPKA